MVWGNKVQISFCHESWMRMNLSFYYYILPIAITFDKVRILKTEMQVQIGFEERWPGRCIGRHTATTANRAKR